MCVQAGGDETAKALLSERAQCASSVEDRPDVRSELEKSGIPPIDLQCITYSVPTARHAGSPPDIALASNWHSQIY